MPTAEQLARLAAIGRQSIAFVQNQSQIGTISTYHRAAINRIRAQARQSIVVVDGQIEGNVPAVPGSVSASTLSSTSIRVTCEDVPNETGYRWYRNTSNDSGTATLVGTTGTNGNAFTDSGLTASTTYYYWVKATNAEGDSAFSSSTNTTTSAPVSPGDGTADQFLGTYLGHFRINDTGFSKKLFGGNRDQVIGAHPDGDKLYYLISGPGIESLGTAGGQRGYITTITIPDIGSLSPDDDITESPLGTPAISTAWVELTEDYADDRVSRGLTSENKKYNSNRLFGVAYDSVNEKLFVNFGQHYKVSPELTPCVREVDPETLQPIGDFYMPTAWQIHPSAPNGPLISLQGTALSDLGDFLVAPNWGLNPGGPRWSSMTLDSESSEAVLKGIVNHPTNSPHPAASKKLDIAQSWATATHLLSLVKNGRDGWYGYPDAVDRDTGEYIGGPKNYTPDPWSIGGGKGWKAPPYYAEVWAAPVSQLLEVDNGTRATDGIDFTIVDITSRMIRETTHSVQIGGITGPFVTVTTKKCEVSSLTKMAGYYFAMEKEAIDGNQPAAVIHVWSGDN